MAFAIGSSLRAPLCVGGRPSASRARPPHFPLLARARSNLRPSRSRVAVAAASGGQDQESDFEKKRKDVEVKYDAWVDKTAAWLDGRQSELDGGAGGGGPTGPGGGGGGGGGGEGGGGAKKVFSLAWMTFFYSFMYVSYLAGLWKNTGEIEGFDLAIGLVAGALLAYVAVRLFAGPITTDIWTLGTLLSATGTAWAFRRARSEGWELTSTVLTVYGGLLSIQLGEGLRLALSG